MAWIGHTLAALGPGDDDVPALAWTGGELSRAVLRQRVAQAARALADRTPANGRIAIDLPNGPALPILVLAAARAGRAALVFDPAWPAATRQRVVETTAPDLIVSPHAADCPAAILIARPPDPGGEEEGPPLPAPSGESVFYVSFTSGSTGEPKGCARSHASWLASFALGTAVSGVGASDRVLTLGAFAHSIHLYAALEAIHYRAEIAFLSAFRPTDALDLARRRASTVVYGTPAHYLMIAETARRRGLPPLPAVRRIVTGGAKWRARVPEAIRRLFPAAEVVEFYGASETSFITAARVGETVPAGSVGFPLAGVDLQVRRADGVPAKIGESGAIWVRSPMLFSIYLCGEDPETRWDGDWLTIGDVGHRDAQGALFLDGRRKRMIVSAARNVFAEEVEGALRGIAGVGEAAVFGLPDSLRGEMIVAAVCPDPAAGLDEPGLRSACRAVLAEPKVPRRFVILDDWPLTSAGKTDLAAIRAQAERQLLVR